MINLKATYKQLKGDYKRGGLDLDIPLDGTEWSLGAFWDKKIGKAPREKFMVSNIPEVRDQGSTDFCAAFQTMYTMVQDFGIKLSPSYLFAMAKKRFYGGDISGFGLALKHPLTVAQKDGCCEENFYPFNASRNWLANWNNISNKAHNNARTRLMKKGFFLVDIYADKFENFAAAMFNWDEMIVTGIKWYGGFYIDNNQHLILRKTGGATGHAIGAIGFDFEDSQGRMWFINSYKKMPKFWLTAQEVRNVIFYGYILSKNDLPIDKIIKKYAGKAIMSEEKGKSNVYYISEGKKRKFPTEVEAWSHGFHLWNDIIKVDDTELNSIPAGTDMTASDGIYYKVMKEIFAIPSNRFEDLKNRIK